MNKEQGTRVTAADVSEGDARERPFIIVTGAGRSGTSAVARVLHESGARMGSDLAEPSDANPDGFYEDWGALWLNERLLRDVGMGDRWRSERWPSRATVLAAAQRYRDEMAALVADATDGWKDPRFALTLEAWLPLLSSKPKVVVCLRSPEAYAESVVRVYGLVDRAAAERQWARHYRRLLEVIRDYRLEAICIEYDALVEQPEETVAELAAFVGRPLRAEYVDAPLRRHVRAVPERYRPLYERVLGLGPEGQRSRVRGQGTPVEVQRSEFDGRGAWVATEDDAERLEEIVARVRAARDDWEQRVRMPKPRLDDETRVACERYRSVLCEAQRAFAALEPPQDLERRHALTVEQINLQRMIVELTLNAMVDGAGDRRALKQAVRAWRRFGRTAI